MTPCSSRVGPVGKIASIVSRAHRPRYTRTWSTCMSLGDGASHSLFFSTSHFASRQLYKYLRRLLLSGSFTESGRYKGMTDLACCTNIFFLLRRHGTQQCLGDTGFFPLHEWRLRLVCSGEHFIPRAIGHGSGEFPRHAHVPHLAVCT